MIYKNICNIKHTRQMTFLREKCMLKKTNNVHYIIRLMRRISFLFFIFFSCVFTAHADSRPDCLMCGMYLEQYSHVRYEVVTKDNKVHATCGVQCGLFLQLNLKDTFKSATATDLFSHKTLPASKAWYVYKSSVITDMGPGFIAFASRKQAENFITGFGGNLFTYQEGLNLAKTGLK